MINWFKKLDYRLQYTAFIGLWSILWLWALAVIGNLNWCAGIASDCDLDWINATSVVSILIIWGCGIAALVIYHDHISDHGTY